MGTHSHSSQVRTDSDFRTHAPYSHHHATAHRPKSDAKHRLGPIVQITAVDSDDALDSLYLPSTSRQSRPSRSFANAGPLGLCAFALNTFMLSLVHVRARGLQQNSILIGAAYAYGGLVQLLAGMWEMASGNTFGATTLASYGGYWISWGIIFTPGGFDVVETLNVESGGKKAFLDSFGFYLMGWFIFTCLCLLCTLKSSVAVFSMFFFVALTYMTLAIAYLQPTSIAPDEPNIGVLKAGGYLGLIAAGMAWYNALAGFDDLHNSFFVVPVGEFSWSDIGKEKRKKSESDDE